MRVGAMIKAEREKRGLTQSEVAAHFNVTRQTVSSWETERTYPDLMTIVAISDYFHISLDELLREDYVMVEKITKDVKSNKKRGRIIVILLLFIGLLAGGIALTYPNYRDQLATSIPIEKFDVEVNLNGDRLTRQSEITGTVDLPADKTVHLSNVVYDENTAYVTIFQTFSLFKQNKEIYVGFHSIPDDTSITKVVLVSKPGGMFSSTVAGGYQTDGVLFDDLRTFPQQKILYDQSQAS